MNSRSTPPSRQAKLTTPTQPRILIEIEELMRKPNLNLRTIAKLISQDSVLSGIFLRTINSSYYGLNHKIELVEQAIPLIGLQQTLNLIRAEALKRVTGGDQLALAHNRLHERAQQIARLSTIIADHYLPEYLSPDIAYLIGQFHDSGIPVLMQHYPGYCTSLNAHASHKLPDVAEEDRRIGIDHCEIGYRLAKDWKLPTRVCEAIRHHHDISLADDDTRGYVALLQMAMHLYNRLSHNDDSEWEEKQAAVLQELEIEPENLEEFALAVREKFRAQTEG